MERNINSEQLSFTQSQMKIIDIYTWLESKILQYKIKIQRNSAWKTTDKEELIDTIINGYPIPPIFISSGTLEEDENLVSKNIYYVLDGRQRLESIQNYINKHFKYKSKKYDELDKDERKKILNYYIPLIIIDDSNVENLKQIFKRLNKTAIKLNRIELTASQYFEYPFIIFSKLAVTTKNCQREIIDYIEETRRLYSDILDENISDDEKYENEEIIDETSFEINNLEKGLEEYENLLKENESVYSIFNDNNIFSAYEINRQVNLQHFLNIFVTLIENEIAISRSVIVSSKSQRWQRKIEEYSSDEKKEKIIEVYSIFKEACSLMMEVLNKLDKNSLFYNKSSLYSLSIFFYYNLEKIKEMGPDTVVKTINEYISDDENRDKYMKLVQDQVNEKKIRASRYEILKSIFFPGQNN